MVLDDEYNPKKDIIDLVNEEKKEEIFKLSEKIKYWYKRIKYYENKLKEILNRRGLLTDGLELNPSLEDDDWVNSGVVYYGYFYEYDTDIIGYYNMNNDTFDLDKDSLDKIEKILTGDIKEGLTDKIKSRAPEQEKQKEEYINQILKKPIGEITVLDLSFFNKEDTESLNKLKEKFEKETKKEIEIRIHEPHNRISIICYSSKIKGLFIGFSWWSIVLVHPTFPNQEFTKVSYALEKMKEYEEIDISKYDRFGKLINETNQDLEGKEFSLPEFVKEEIRKNQKEYGMSTKRSNYLLNQNTISYYEIKRLKNFFDKNPDGIDFYLAGGKEMKNWVNNILNQFRSQIQKKKEILYDIGLDNQFKKTHTKDKNKMVKPSLGIDKVSTTSRGLRLE